MGLMPSPARSVGLWSPTFGNVLAASGCSKTARRARAAAVLWVEISEMTTELERPTRPCTCRLFRADHLCECPVEQCAFPHREGKLPLKMLVDQDWLRRKTGTDPDLDQESR